MLEKAGRQETLKVRNPQSKNKPFQCYERKVKFSWVTKLRLKRRDENMEDWI